MAPKIDTHTKRLDELGREILDGKPVAIPAGMKRPPTLAEQVQRLVRVDMSFLASATGRESFEEACDFDVPDDDGYDPSTPYEPYFDPFLGREVTPQMVTRYEKELKTMQEAWLKKRQEDADRAAKRAATPPAPPPPEPSSDA